MRNYCIQLHVELYAANYARSNYAQLLPALYIYIYIGMRLLVHVTNYDELRRLITKTNLRNTLNRVYYLGHSYTREQLSTLRLDFPLYAIVLSDEIVLMGIPIERRVTVSVDDYLDLFA